MINQLVDNILKYIREPLEVSVLMHLLITLSYLCRDRFMRQIEELALAKRIKEFAEYY